MRFVLKLYSGECFLATPSFHSYIGRLLTSLMRLVLKPYSDDFFLLTPGFFSSCARVNKTWHVPNISGSRCKRRQKHSCSKPFPNQTSFLTLPSAQVKLSFVNSQNSTSTPARVIKTRGSRRYNHRRRYQYGYSSQTQGNPSKPFLISHTTIITGEFTLGLT